MTAPDYTPGTCPECGNQHALTIEFETLVLACGACGHVCEHETRENPERELCDNCAFRPGSAELDDLGKALTLVQCVQSGKPFYCHKGLHVTFTGKRIRFAEPDPATAPLCAGYRAMREAFLRTGDFALKPGPSIELAGENQ